MKSNTPQERTPNLDNLKGYHVLLVDDEAENLEILERHLERLGYEVSSVRSSAEGFAKIEERVPDMILLDIRMPEVSGQQMLLVLREMPETRSVPIIMVSALGDSEEIVKALRTGANDYVTKPIDIDVLSARMETHLQLAATLRQLEIQTELLERLAAYDDLTGVYSRRSLFDALESECAMSRREKRCLSLLMLDIDGLKPVNDAHGHAAGDALLKEFAQRVRPLLRRTDVIGRYGGDEFCVILPEINAGTAISFADRIRLTTTRAPFDVGPAKVNITASIGIASLKPNEDIPARQLVDEADKALYSAKKRGNSVNSFVRPIGRD